MGEPAAGSRVILGIRPHDFEEASLARAGLPTIEVEASIVEQTSQPVSKTA